MLLRFSCCLGEAEMKLSADRKYLFPQKWKGSNNLGQHLEFSTPGPGGKLHRVTYRVGLSWELMADLPLGKYRKD